MVLQESRYRLQKEIMVPDLLYREHVSATFQKCPVRLCCWSAKYSVVKIPANCLQGYDTFMDFWMISMAGYEVLMAHIANNVIITTIK